MSLRAIILGLALGLFISGATYFNDLVVGQRHFIGGLLPVVVAGALLVLLLVVNPLLRGRALQAGELAMIVALGMAACAWPAATYFRVYSPVVAMPGYLYKDRPAWQGAELLSYVPGGSPRIAPGQVRDWSALSERLVAGDAAAEDSAGDAAGEALRYVWQSFPQDVRQYLRQRPETGGWNPPMQHRLLSVLNDLIERADLVDAAPFAVLRQTDAAAAYVERAATLRQKAADHVQRAEAMRQQRAAITVELASRLDALDVRRREAEQQRDEAILRRYQVESALSDTRERLSAIATELHAISREPDSPRLAAQVKRLEAQREQLRQRRQELNREGDDLERQAAAARDQVRIVGRETQRVRRPLTLLDHDLKLAMLHAESGQHAITVVRQRLSRNLLDQVLGASVAPPPVGKGWLLAGGTEDPLATGMLVSGWDGHHMLGPTQVPWKQWGPTLRLWVPLTLLLALAALCLMLVVHPQWSKHELLPYPIARFIEEVTQRESGRWLPDVARSRLFWLAVVGVSAIHMVNGLHAYNPTFIQIPLRYDFLPMRALFPLASQSPLAWSVFLPGIFFSIVGFSFFLRTEVSLSFGLSGVAYMILASMIYRRGIAMEYDPTYGGNTNLILFGAWLGGALVVLYVGRRYYASVLARSMGMSIGQVLPSYAVWAGRGLMVASVAAVWVMSRAGLPWTIAALLMLLVLMVFLMLARINAETGAFFILPEWIPLAVLLALLGERAMGPTAVLTAGLVALMFAGETREAMTPLLANGLRMTEQTGTRPARMGLLLGLMLLLGFGATLLATQMYTYNLGLPLQDEWATRIVPSKIPDAAVKAIDELSARQQLSESVSLGPLQRLAAIEPRPGAMGWIALGSALVLTCAAARLRFAWWPLHPVLFMVFGTHPAAHAHYSFLLGWAIKLAVVRLGGARSYHLVMPLMVGLIAADVLAGLFWTGVGSVVHFLGGSPVRVPIFPP